MPSERRKGDIKVLVGATIAVLLLGGFIAGAAIVTTRGGGGVECGQLPVGLASDIRNNLDSGGPYFVTGGARCGFWLALENGDIVAYKAIQPSGCTLKLRLDHWSCGSATVPVSGVAKTATYTRAYGESNGFLTLLSDGERLTGAYALGPESGEWLQQATLAIRASVPLDVLQDTIQPFPTFSEIYVDALKALRGEIAAAS